MTGGFYLTYALRSLLRGGQRTVLALICIAFGVMALVAMQLLASMIREATVVAPEMQLGGSLQVHRDRVMTPAELSQLRDLQRAGLIQKITLFAPNAELSMVRREGSGRVHFLSRALGIDAATYPLIGELQLSQPADASVRDVLRAPGDVIVTRDVAKKLRLEIGTLLQLGGPWGASPQPLRVAGIATVIPDRRGDSVLYDTATARLIAGGRDVITSAALIASEDAARRLEQAGWKVTRARDVKPGTASTVFDTMLKGAGILGLLIGGIGVANTLSVLLARRTLEIATLKAIGYRQRDLFALFGIETALLGMTGAILGGAAAALVSRQLMGLLDRMEGSLMLVYRVDPRLIIGGIAVGAMTATLFGVYAIAKAIAVRPAVLLRGSSSPPTPQTRRTIFVLAGIAALVFGALSSVVMGSVLRGAGVIMIGVVGLVVLTPLFAALLFGILRLPLPGNMLNIARRNLQHQPVRSVIAMIALFIGAFSIGVASAAMLSARDRVAARRGSDAGLNLSIYGRPADEPVVSAALRKEGVTDFESRYLARVTTARPAGEPVRLAAIEGTAIDRKSSNLRITAGTWLADEHSALLPAASAKTLQLALGDSLVLSTANAQHTVRIAGFYEVIEPEGFSAPRTIVSSSTALALGGEDASATFLAAVPVERLELVAENVGRAAPTTMLISKADFNDLIVRTYNSLFLFAAAMSGLALIAGAVLIANAVGLALVERRRELGILKALGYTSWRVLSTILLENGLLGILAGVTGVLAVRIVIAIANTRLPALGMTLGAGTAASLLVLSAGLALISAIIVAWRPTRLRPLVVLREE